VEREFFYAIKRSGAPARRQASRRTQLSWLKGRDLELVIGEALCNWVNWRLSG
jgi:hypothetical protein